MQTYVDIDVAIALGCKAGGLQGQRDLLDRTLVDVAVVKVPGVESANDNEGAVTCCTPLSIGCFFIRKKSDSGRLAS